MAKDCPGPLYAIVRPQPVACWNHHERSDLYRNDSLLQLPCSINHKFILTACSKASLGKDVLAIDGPGRPGMQAASRSARRGRRGSDGGWAEELGVSLSAR